MAINFNCENCGARYQVDDRVAGQPLKCTKCGKVMRVPTAGPELHFREDEAEPAADETVAPAVVPPKPAQRSDSQAPARPRMERPVPPVIPQEAPGPMFQVAP